MYIKQKQNIMDFKTKQILGFTIIAIGGLANAQNKSCSPEQVKLIVDAASIKSDQKVKETLYDYYELNKL